MSLPHTKDDYILRRLSKISKKKWEFFVISRVIHKLDDPDIEFTTQQLVRRRCDGKRALTDMYFPQFGIHLEIDEGQHLDELHAEADKRRTEDIVSVTGHQVHRIAAAERIDEKTVRDLPIKTVCDETDKFIEIIRSLKAEKIRAGETVSWDFENRYKPEIYIKAGFVDVEKNVLFRRQADALRCFGYEGGNYQRGAWRIPDMTGDLVWFPRLYERDDWDNELTPDGKCIFERPKSDKAKAWTSKSPQSDFDKGNRITFARVKDALGYTLYRYVGTFTINRKLSSVNETRFDLKHSREAVRPAKPKTNQ